MGFAFLKGALGKKSRDAKTAIIAAAAKIDFDMVKAGQLEELRAMLTDLTNKLGAAQTQLEKEKADVVAIEAAYNTKISQAEILMDKAIAPATNMELKAKFETAAAKLVEDAEGMVEQIELEKQEATEAEVDVKELQALVEDMVKKISAAEKAMNKAKADMDRKARQLAVVEEKAKQAEQMAGLRDAVNGFDTVVGALNKKATDMDARIAAAKVKAKALGNTTNTVDADVQAVLDAAAGNAKPKMSVAERLAALKK